MTRPSDVSEGDYQEVTGELDGLGQAEALLSPPSTAITLRSTVETPMARFTPEQEAVLLAPIDPDLIQILPTGELYLSQVQYRRVLWKAFGPGGWRLLPTSPETIQGNSISREYALWIEGRVAAVARGEADYQPDNDRMSYATADESAKSNALMRCCKDIGIASELWDKSFNQPWIQKYAVKVWAGKDKPLWRRRDDKPFYKETGVASDSPTPPGPPPAPRAPAPAGPADPSTPLNGVERATRITNTRVKKTGEKGGKPYVVFEITDDKGIKYDTFSDSHSDVAAEAIKTGRPVKITSTEPKRRGWNHDLVEIELLGPLPADLGDFNVERFKWHMGQEWLRLGQETFDAVCFDILGPLGITDPNKITDPVLARTLYRAMQRKGKR